MLSKKYRQARKKEICGWLKENEIHLAVLEDREGRRDSSLRYLTGHPGDALLFLLPHGREGKTILLPWDEILAEKYAAADEVLPYENFGRNLLAALDAVIKQENLKSGSRVELPASLPVWQLENLRLSHPQMEFICRPSGFTAKLSAMRTIKDESEIALLSQGAAYTNQLIAELEEEIKTRRLKTELDAALFLERRSRSLGCEGMAFETLAAGPGRSWGIHAFPSFTAGEFASPGLSLVDFGLKYQGYVSDVSLSFIRGKLSSGQQEMTELVTEAYKTAEGLLKPGASTRTIALAADNVFRSAGWVMPHLLGHGIGLDAHEGPYFRTGKESEEFLAAGMVHTLEPGLYHRQWGGLRWENDYLITSEGCQKLTESRIIRLPD